MYTKIKKTSSPFVLVLVIITFFVFIVSFTTFYSVENFQSACGCQLPIWIIIVAIASFGVFTGSLLYYVVNKNLIKEKKDIKNAIYRLLDFLENDEKKVMKFVIENSGRIHQSRIAKELKIDKVKVSRILGQLEARGFVAREKKGMTNIVYVDEEIRKLFH